MTIYLSGGMVRLDDECVKYVLLLGRAWGPGGYSTEVVSAHDHVLHHCPRIAGNVCSHTAHMLCYAM